MQEIRRYEGGGADKLKKINPMLDHLFLSMYNISCIILYFCQTQEGPAYTRFLNFCTSIRLSPLVEVYSYRAIRPRNPKLLQILKLILNDK